MRPAQFSVQTGHIFQQSPQRVFDHWQQSLLQGRWLFATPQGRMQGAYYRASPNNHFVVQYGQVTLRGQWLNVQRPHLLFCSFMPPERFEMWQEPDLLQLNLSSHPMGCEARLTHQTSAHWRSQADKLVEGWTHIFAAVTAELNDANLPCGKLLR